MNTIKLDNWDFAVIYYVKQEPKQTIAGIREIWAERCMLEVEDITTQCLVEHFYPIILSLSEITKNLTHTAESIIVDAAPCNKWQFREMDVQNDGADVTIEYFNNIFRVICSRLRLCDVKYLDGFHEYYERRKANSVLV
jgi:hypothetical protein